MDKVMSETIHYCWLHLSDTHFGHGDHSNKWDQRLILKQIVSDIESRTEKKLPDPNAIFITGDSANTGGCEPSLGDREYEDAKIWLENICKKLKLTKDNVYLVPGNHDLQRDITSDRKTNRLLRELKDHNDTIDPQYAKLVV